MFVQLSNNILLALCVGGKLRFDTISWGKGQKYKLPRMCIQIALIDNQDTQKSHHGGWQKKRFHSTCRYIITKYK